jgi:pyrimidine-nucleoside phosphorylase
MKTEKDARALADALVRVGTAAGKQVTALLTDMSAPLGRTVGNAIETREAIDLLHGRGPADLLECTLALGAEMLRLGKVAATEAEARAMLKKAIAGGAAARTMERMIEAQGGDPRVVEDTGLLPSAAVKVGILAEHAGFITGIDPLEIGLAAVAMGAGRTRADQAVDPVVGIELEVGRGDAIEAGAPLAHLHVRHGGDADAVIARVRAAFQIGPARVATPALVLARIGA